MSNEQLALLLDMLAQSLKAEVDNIAMELPDDLAATITCMGIEKRYHPILRELYCKIDVIKNQANSLRRSDT